MATDLAIPGGVVPPIPTFLDDSGRISSDQSSHLEMLHEAGVDGVLTLGTVGEGATLDAPVRSSAITAAATVMKNRHVVAGCAGQTSAAILDQIREAEECGATAALVLPPFYFGLSQDALLAVLTEVADRSPLQVMLYHIPARTGNPFEAKTVQRLAEHPNIVGIKDSGGDFMRYLQLRRTLAADDFVVFQGVAPLIGTSLLAGANDTMCTVTALLPRHEMELRSAIARADMDAVGAGIRIISQIAELFRLGPYPIPVNFKQVAALLELGPARPHEPALAPGSSHIETLAEGLRRCALDAGGDLR